MSLPAFTTQAELFSTAGLSGCLFGPTDRYRLFALKIYPVLAQARSQLEACYCVDNGRVALEPVLLLGVSLLQYLEAIPDRQAVELLRYHAGWNFALNRQLGDEVFHPTTLVNFRQRLLDNNLSTIGFETVLEALIAAGLVARQSRQRLDSTQMFGRVSRMSRLDCVRESLRLALKELAAALEPDARPVFWGGLWERYVESQTDYRASSETLVRKLAESGSDAWQLLEWLREPTRSALAQRSPARLLARVFAEQFEIQAGTAVLTAREKVVGAVTGTTTVSVEKEPSLTVQSEAGPTQDQILADNQPLPPMTKDLAVSPAPTATTSNGAGSVTGRPPEDPTRGQAEVSGAVIRPKDNKELASDRVQNPHDPDATYAVKGEGEKKKEHVGYKVQVAETVSETVLAPGEPTGNFICGIVTHAARESDEEGSLKMAIEQQDMGMDKPPVQYVDAAYISTQELMKAAAEGRELIGPAPGAVSKSDGRFCSDHFNVMVEQRKAICPAGQENSQCSRLEERTTGKVSYRFEWSSSACGICPLRQPCMKTDQKHRTLVVGEHHTILQERRREQKTEPFKQRMKHRNAIEGTQSELVRAHGLRRARYRGLPKTKLQNYFIGAACNTKRWFRCAAWELKNGLTAILSPVTAS
jgi:transposase